MEGAHRVLFRRLGPEPDLPDRKHLVAFLLQQCLWTGGGRCVRDVSRRPYHRCALGPDGGGICRQVSSPLGQIPLMAYRGRHPAGCFRHAMFLERFQRP